MDKFQAYFPSVTKQWRRCIYNTNECRSPGRHFGILRASRYAINQFLANSQASTLELIDNATSSEHIRLDPKQQNGSYLDALGKRFSRSYRDPKFSQQPCRGLHFPGGRSRQVGRSPRSDRGKKRIQMKGRERRKKTALARLNSCQAGDPTGTFAALHNYELLATLHFLYQRMCGIASTERNNGLWLLQSSGVIGELLFKARKRCKH